jgi:hypothetical protein
MNAWMQANTSVKEIDYFNRYLLAFCILLEVVDQVYAQNAE